eukprot:SAG22_NODE_7522_length_731_cov_2.463608_1_plen_48_part_10
MCRGGLHRFRCSLLRGCGLGLLIRPARRRYDGSQIRGPIALPRLDCCG